VEETGLIFPRYCVTNIVKFSETGTRNSTKRSLSVLYNGQDDLYMSQMQAAAYGKRGSIATANSKFIYNW
jgi:hypothetical protein